MTNDERMKRIANDYLEVVCPYLMQYETLTNDFPISILNEIRSAFTHLAEFYATDDETVKSDMVTEMEGHFKRILRDCYKYVCEAIEDEYSEFSDLYRYVDLSLVSNGEFVTKLVELRNSAIDKMMIARKKELESDIKKVDESELLSLYEETFVEYDNLHNLIKNEKPHADALKHKTIEEDLKKKKKERRYEVLTWVFGITSVVGVILTIVGFLT